MPRGLVLALILAALVTIGGTSLTCADEPDPEPTPTARPDPFACLQPEVDRGRLDAEVLEALREQGRSDALVTLDDREIRALAEQRRIERGLPFEDGEVLAEKSAAYAALKARVLSAAGDGITTLRDYESLPVLYAAFEGPAALCALLAQEAVVAVEANRAFGPLAP